MRRVLRLGLIPAIAVLGACHASDPTGSKAAGADPQRGAADIARLGCGACHAIPGISGAAGRVGPPLAGIGRRTIIAGVLPNTPENMVTWLRNPQRVVPGNAMPNMELSDRDARDIAAYLYTLR